jgi:4-amino-4-deoxy-L-arabinose transferase-like glycosyltransferase
MGVAPRISVPSRDVKQGMRRISKLLPRTDWLLCGLIIVWGSLRLLPDLGHPGMPRWDESIHQVVARGTMAEPLRPHVYRDHLFPYSNADWVNGGAWIHKPPMPFWLGAIFLRVVGATPLALRLVSFFADLVVALAMFLLMRRSVGRWLSALAGAAFLSLDFTWALTQGFRFGDVTDTTLAACLVVSVLVLVRAVERSSVRWAALAGALMGVGYLCKSVLALTPVGIAAVFLVLHLRRVARGLRLPAFAALVGALVAVALPWTLYSALAWPKQYRANAALVFQHLTIEIFPWGRPIDALFNEIYGMELLPIPVVLAVLAGAWMLWRACSWRRPVDIALALWIGSSWIVLSLTPSKVPAHGYGVVPAMLAAIAVLMSDARRRPVLAAGALAAMLAGVLVKALPALAKVRAVVPVSLPQTREQPGLAEGLVLVVFAMMAVWLLSQGLRRRVAWVRMGLGWMAIVGCVALLGVATPFARQAERQQLIAQPGATSYAREVGLALQREAPKKSVLFIGTQEVPACCSETHALMFYSGKMAYRQAPDVAAALAKGYAPFLVSPLAESFAPVPGVPANAWWRAYDLREPLTQPAQIPQGLTPLVAHTAALELLGIARGPAVGGLDRWTLVARLTSAADHSGATLVFQTRKGSKIVPVGTGQTLLDPASLANAAWFVLPFLGPARAEVTGLHLDDGTPLSLPPEE